MQRANLISLILLAWVVVLTVALLRRNPADQVTSIDQSTTIVPTDARALAALDDHFTFMIASDLGRNGYYDQRPVAEMMGEVAAITGVEVHRSARGCAPLLGCAVGPGSALADQFRADLQAPGADDSVAPGARQPRVSRQHPRPCSTTPQ